MLSRNKRLVIFTVTVLALLVASTLLPASAQLSQWQSQNPYRDGTLPISGTTAPPFLHSVHLLSSTYGWAVGGDCDIYKLAIAKLGSSSAPACQALPGKGFALFYDGTIWRNVLVPTATGTLTAVFAVTTTDVWAVGLGPTILHWDGTAWALVPAPAGTGDLFGLYMLPSGTDGWAVGNENGVTDNIRWSGTFPNGAWSPGPKPILLPGAPVLRAVSLSSPTFGWIVASDGSIFKWDGAGWQSQFSPVSVDLLSVFASSDTDAWAVGKGSTIIRWNGASWTGPMVAPTTGLDYRSIKMVSATDGWIAGELNTSTVEGLLLRWNGVAWSIVRSWVTQDLNGLFMLPGGIAGSVVGDAETIVSWNNVQWISRTSPTDLPLFDLTMVSSSDGWAVGGPFPLGYGGGPGGLTGTMGSSIFHWDGTHWFHYETLPSPNTLLGVFMLNTNDGWAVGNAAISSAPPVILRWDGASWTDKSPPGVALGGTLTDVYALSPTEAWAVGFGASGAPPILKWDGAIWASVPPGALTTGVLTRLYMVSSTDGWAVGCTDLSCGTPVILRWNGLAWSSVTPPAGVGGLLDVFMLSPTNGWAVGLPPGVGKQGTIIHWDGAQWRTVPAPPNAFLTSVYMITATDGWAVGYDTGTNLSLILHWNGLTWDVVSTSPVPSTMKNILTSVFMVSALDGWIVSGYTFIPVGLGFGPGSGLFLHYGPEVVPGTTTSTTTSTSFTTVISTITSSTTSTTSSTTSTTSSSTMTPASGGTWGVPGFPIESILAGLVAGVAVLAVLRHRPRRRS